MEAFFDFLKYFFLGLFALIAIFLVLMSLPKSKLRAIVLEFMGWGTTAVSAVSVVSPIDAIPDFIPVLGQLDDIGMIVVGICSAILAYRMRNQRKEMERYEKGY